MIFNSHELAWAAGVFDGEGSAQLLTDSRNINTMQVLVSIIMTHELTVRTFAKIFGGGSIDRVPARKSNHKEAWKFAISGKYGIGLMKLIYPYLVTKREHAEILIAFGVECLGVYNRFNPLPEQVIIRRRELKDRLDKLNQRGS